MMDRVLRELIVAERRQCAKSGDSKRYFSNEISLGVLSGFRFFVISLLFRNLFGLQIGSFGDLF